MNLPSRSLIALMLFLWSLPATSKIILISHDSTSREKADQIRQLIIKERHIPASFIDVITTRRPCLANKKTVVHLCVKQKEMKLIHIQKKAVQEILSEFKNGED